MSLHLKKLEKNIYLIQELDYKESCNCYLIIGTKKCLLIDFGVGLSNFSNYISKIIGDKKLIKILTHFHYDHFGGSKYFDKILANKVKIKDVGIKYFKEEDFKNKNCYLKASNNLAINLEKFIHIKNGEIIDIGDFSFEVIYTPGHDSSSICLFENKRKILFSGDLIYGGELYYNFKDSVVNKYVNSLIIISKLSPKIIYGGHNSPICHNEITEKIIQSIQKLNKHN